MTLPLSASRSTTAPSVRLQPTGAISKAASAAALYALLVISRLPELVGPLARVRPLLILAFVAAVFAFSLSRSRLRTVLAARELRALFAIMALAIVGAPVGLWPGQSLRGVLFNFSKSVLFFFLLLYCIRSFRELRITAWAGAGAAGVLGLAIVLLSGAGRSQVGGTYDPNDTAFVMVYLLPIAVMLMAAESGRRRWVLAGVVCLCLLTIIMTKSRGGFVALVVVALILFAKLPSRQAGLKVGIVAGGLVVFSLFAPQSYWDRISTIWGGESKQTAVFDEYAAGGISSARWELWKTGVQIMLENPVLGVGMGNFSFAEGLTHGGGKFGSGKWNAPHNSFTQIGAELGVGGLFLLLYLLYRALTNCRSVIRVAKRNPQLRYNLLLAQGLEAGLWGYIVGGMALSQAYSDLLYFLIAMSVLLKWFTARQAAQVAGTDSSVLGAGALPWWKMPR